MLGFNILSYSQWYSSIGFRFIWAFCRFVKNLNSWEQNSNDFFIVLNVILNYLYLMSNPPRQNYLDSYQHEVFYFFTDISAFWRAPEETKKIRSKNATKPKTMMKGKCISNDTQSWKKRRTSEGIGLKLAEMVEITTTKWECNLLIPIHYTSQRIAVDISYFLHVWLARL